MRLSARTHVVVAGGGVAALETCLALRALAGDRAFVTLIAPDPYFTYRPIGLHDPLAARGLVRVPLARLARDAGADLRHDRITGVDPAARRVRTASGCELAYDALVLAIGATAIDAPAGAVPLADSAPVLRELAGGDIGSVAFVEPAAPARSLDLYDLALEAAVAAGHAPAAPGLTLVTAEPAPLAIAGARAADTLRVTLASHGIRLVESEHVRAVADGELDLAPGPRRVFAERTIVAPRLRGPWLRHLPCDGEGFLPADPLGRVPGVDGVFAAGDCTAFPVKHPSLAAQQADTVGASIAGAPEPFKPVLRCMLPSRLRWYVEASLVGGQGDATRLSAHPLWPGDARFGARYLTPWLAELQDDEAHGGRDRPAALVASQ